MVGVRPRLPGLYRTYGPHQRTPAKMGAKMADVAGMPQLGDLKKSLMMIALVMIVRVRCIGVKWCGKRLLCAGMP